MNLTKTALVGLLSLAAGSANAAIIELNAGGTVGGTGDQTTGTLIDTDVTSNLTVSTDTGLFVTGSEFNFFRYNERTTGNGTYTIDFSEAVSDLSFAAGSLGWVTGNSRPLIGNFGLTFVDGTVISNAGFTVGVNPLNGDARPVVFDSDTELAVAVNVGGFDYLSDPTANAIGSTQASAYINFNDIIAGSQATGVTSLSFETVGNGTGPTSYFQVFGDPFVEADVPVPGALLLILGALPLLRRFKRN